MHVVLECGAMHDLRMEYDDTLFTCIPRGAASAPQLARRGTPDERGKLLRVGAEAAPYMREFMNQHPSTLASFIHRCLQSRKSMLDFLPYLEPLDGIDQWVDTFDSDSD